MEKRCCCLVTSILVLFGACMIEASHYAYDQSYIHSLAAEKKQAGVSPSADNYRSGYHFQPVGHWMNDPNAPMFYKGYYHLFYQYNPQSAIWGMIRWGHAVSKDLITWNHLAKAAVYPVDWYDLNGAWSGSVTFVKGSSDTEPVPVVMYTGNTNESVQVTLMARPADPSDPLLLEWTKSPMNPVMVPDDFINVSSFRDPTTAWMGPQDGHWRLIVGNKKMHHNDVGRALVYRSRDFARWKKAKHPLHSAPTTGMWECPDFYPVPLKGSTHGLDTTVISDATVAKYVLKNSLDNYKVDYYTVGKYLPSVDRFVPDEGSVEGPDGLRYDYGKFYASKTFFDQNTQRRILWGWINESDSIVDDVSRGWAGLQALPRVVRLDPATKKSLILWPVKEVESLRGESMVKSNVVIEPQTTMALQGFSNGSAQVDIEAVFEIASEAAFNKVEGVATKTATTLCGEMSSKKYHDLREGGFGVSVLASSDGEERSSVMFKLFQDKTNPSLRKAALCVDQTRSTLRKDADTTSYGGFVNVAPNQHSFSLRVLVDRSIVESFAEGGRTCITSRSYPLKGVANNAQIFAFNHMMSSSVSLSNLTVWNMQSAQSVYESFV